MRRIMFSGAAAAVTIWGMLAAAGPAVAGGAASSTASELAICKRHDPPAGWHCEPPVPRALESFRGVSAAAAIRALGVPERTRSLSSGARVLVWDRSGIALAEGGRVVRREECYLQMAVARSGVVADVFLTSASRSCARRFRLAGE